MSKAKNNLQDDQIKKLEEVLDEHENEQNAYIGKTFLYRCTSCGSEKYVKGDELDDVNCDECGEEMQIAEEGIYDKGQEEDVEERGQTELETLQDKVENSDKSSTDDIIGNISDISEADEDLEDLDLEIDLEEEEVFPDDESLEDFEDDEDLDSFENLIPDDEEDGLY